MGFGKQFLLDEFKALAGSSAASAGLALSDLKPPPWMITLGNSVRDFIQRAVALPTRIASGNLTGRDLVTYLDTTNNAALDRVELAPLITAFASASDAAKIDVAIDAAFERCDINGNGRLEGAELDDPAFARAMRASLGPQIAQSMESAISTSISMFCPGGHASANEAKARILTPASIVYLPTDHSQDGEPMEGSPPLAQALKHLAMYRVRSTARGLEDKARGRLLSRVAWAPFAQLTNQEGTNLTAITRDMLNTEWSTRMSTRALEKMGEFTRGVRNFISDVTDHEWIVDVCCAFLHELASDRSRFTLWCFAITFYWANVIACCFAFLVIKMAMVSYDSLVASFRSGKKTFYGAAIETAKMHHHEAAVTTFPAIIAFSIVLSWIMGFLICSGTGMATTMLLIYRETVWTFVAPYFWYYFTYLAVFFLLREVLLNRVLVNQSTGEIVYPRFFAFVWVVLMVYNFVLGLTIAIFRVLVMLVYTCVCICFVHFSIFPERLMAFDPGYYSLHVTAYTGYARENPIKKAFISLLVPQVNQKYVREDADSDDEPDPKCDPKVRKMKAKARFNLALTLWRNPELKQQRLKEKGEEKVRHSHCFGLCDPCCDEE